MICTRRNNECIDFGPLPACSAGNYYCATLLVLHRYLDLYQCKIGDILQTHVESVLFLQLYYFYDSRCFPFSNWCKFIIHGHCLRRTCVFLWSPIPHISGIPNPSSGLALYLPSRKNRRTRTVMCQEPRNKE